MLDVSVLTIDPIFADAYCNMGNCYKEDGHSGEALQCYQSALKAKPNYPDALTNLAGLLKDGGQFEESQNLYKQALELQGDHTEAFANLIHTNLQICDWNNY